MTNPGDWRAIASLPLESRHGAAPSDLLAHLAHVNGHAACARAVSTALAADVTAALAELPWIVRSQLAPHLLGIFFVTGAGSSAATDIVADQEGQFQGFAIALDVDAIASRSANEWATWRENMPFVPGAFRVGVRIADGADDNRQNALQFLLLHEIGHVLAAGRGLLPDWWQAPPPAADSADYAFLPLSWSLRAGQAAPRARDDFAQRAQLRYYGAPQLPDDAILPMYRALLDTGFFTMYGTLSPDEDFAESFALYVHLELLQKPYFVRIYQGQRLLLQYASEWNAPRLAGKLAVLRQLLPDLMVPARQPYAPLIGVAPLMRRAFRQEEMTPVIAALIARAQAHPHDANAYLDCSTALQLIGQRETALAVQAEAIQLAQHYQPRTGADAALRLLAIMGPGDLMANTPLEFLLEGSDVALDLLYVTPDTPWPAVLPPHDVLMVAVAESDASQPLLARLAAQLRGHSVLNRPEHIAALSRDGACAALAGIPGVLMPNTARIARAELAAVAQAPERLAAFLPDAAFPLIVRPLGSHAGHGLHKIEHAADLTTYLTAVDAERFYLAPFVDYRGADGQYRKFRVALIDGRPFICHYAISSHWMVHYLNAGMDQSEAKRAEEARCMELFDDTFAVQHRQALAEIGRRMGLPYLGIDCAQLPDGRLLVFEVDNAMIVHAMDDEGRYPYKQPAMRKVFSAFRRLLARWR